MNSKKTFIINRSTILKNILLEKGWKEADKNEEIYFSFWFSRENVKKGKLMVIPRKITNLIDNKISMYKVLKKNNLTFFLPKTYTNLKNLDENIFDNNKIYFLKNSYSTMGRGVTVIKSYDEINKITKGKTRNFLLQEEVQNPLLDNGCKTTLRVYVLINDKKEIYIHKNIMEIIHSVKYSEDDLDFKIHVDHRKTTHYNLKNRDYYEECFYKIKEICFLTIRPFIINQSFKNKFIIFGLDFILNEKLTPYLIEVNAYPNLWHVNPEQFEIKNEMLTDFVNFLIEPKFNNKKSQQGGWILCNPLFCTRLAQKSLYKKFTHNLYKNVKSYNYILNNSYIISTDYFSKKKFKNDNCLNYLDYEPLSIIGNKYKMYKFMKNYDLLYYTPDTYLDIKDIEDSDDLYFLKHNSSCGQKNIYYGDFNFIQEKYTEVCNSKYSIQKNVKDPLLYSNKKMIFGVNFIVLNNKITYSNDCEHISVQSEKHEYGNFGNLKLIHDVVPFNQLENYQLIFKNINTCIDKFLRCYALELSKYDTSNKISLNRFDIIVNNNFEVKILEVNTYQIGMRKKKRVDDKYCDDLIKFKLEPYLYSFDQIQNDKFIDIEIKKML